MDEHFEQMVKNMYRSCATYLRDTGEVPEGPLIKAARTVVWARYQRHGCDLLKEAIGELESIVGRPADQNDI